MRKVHPALAGFLQMAGVVIYCALVGLFFTSDFNPGRTILAPILMLLLLVFSVALVGLLTFGYPAYLALQQRIKEALLVLGYMFVYLVVVLAVIFWFLF